MSTKNDYIEKDNEVLAAVIKTPQDFLIDRTLLSVDSIQFAESHPIVMKMFRCLGYAIYPGAGEFSHEQIKKNHVTSINSIHLRIPSAALIEVDGIKMAVHHLFVRFKTEDIVAGLEEQLQLPDARTMARQVIQQKFAQLYEAIEQLNVLRIEQESNGQNYKHIVDTSIDRIFEVDHENQLFLVRDPRFPIAVKTWTELAKLAVDQFSPDLFTPDQPADLTVANNFFGISFPSEHNNTLNVDTKPGETQYKLPIDTPVLPSFSPKRIESAANSTVVANLLEVDAKIVGINFKEYLLYIDDVASEEHASIFGNSNKSIPVKYDQNHIKAEDVWTMRDRYVTIRFEAAIGGKVTDLLATAIENTNECLDID